ncbi:hypothetical protein BRD13_03250, partial [Halobacteriales archaeon SW_5_70_135]
LDAERPQSLQAQIVYAWEGPQVRSRPEDGDAVTGPDGRRHHPVGVDVGPRAAVVAVGRGRVGVGYGTAWSPTESVSDPTA